MLYWECVLPSMMVALLGGCTSNSDCNLLQGLLPTIMSSLLEGKLPNVRSGFLEEVTSIHDEQVIGGQLEGLLPAVASNPLKRIILIVMSVQLVAFYQKTLLLVRDNIVLEGLSPTKFSILIAKINMNRLLPTLTWNVRFRVI